MIRTTRARCLAVLFPAIALAAFADGVRPPPRAEKLWEQPLRPEGTVSAAEGFVLVPTGVEVVALKLATGAEAWRYAFTEERGGLAVPARVHGVATVRMRSGHGVAIAVGAVEVHGVALASGRPLWKHRERLCCVLALSLGGDGDGDGVRDVLVTGCNSVVCISSVTGAALWEFPVSGRSWWTNDAGDLDGDGRNEALVHSAGTVHAVRAKGAGEAAQLWSASASMQPRAAFAQPRGVVLLSLAGAIENLAGADGAVRWRAQAPAGKFADARLSPDGRNLLVSAGGSIARVALADGAMETIGRTDARAAAFLPERTHLALGFADGAVSVFDCATRTESPRAPVATEPIEALLAGSGDVVIAFTEARTIAVRTGPEKTER